LVPAAWLIGTEAKKAKTNRKKKPAYNRFIRKPPRDERLQEP
jgi:hypothetical protein